MSGRARKIFPRYGDLRATYSIHIHPTKIPDPVLLVKADECIAILAVYL